MTFDEFFRIYDGKAVDYDGASGIQCVDLAKLYNDKVLGIAPKAIGNAEAYWNKYDEIPMLHDNFAKVPNDPDYVPQKRRFGCLGKSTLWTYCSSTG